MEFIPFPKIPRLMRDVIVTEKIDGTNASIIIDDTGHNMLVGSRNRYITVEEDNYGFARWCNENFRELLKLGPGRHYGEWWGNGIQRGYDVPEKRFSLFNVERWRDSSVRPACCGVVPMLYSGPFNLAIFEAALADLKEHGSKAAPGFNNPEGIVIYHTASRQMFKQTIERDAAPKSLPNLTDPKILAAGVDAARWTADQRRILEATQGPLPVVNKVS